MGGARSKLFIGQVTFLSGCRTFWHRLVELLLADWGGGGGGEGRGGEANNKYSLVNDCVPRTKLY